MNQTTQFVNEVDKQLTKELKGNETFLFAYNNPNTFRGTGYHLLGEEDQLVRLLAGIVDTLSLKAKEELMSHLVVDDPNTVIAAALAYIDEKEKKGK